MPSGPETAVATCAVPPARTALTLTPATGLPADVTIPVTARPWVTGARATATAVADSAQTRTTAAIVK